VSGCCWALTDSTNVHGQSLIQYFQQSDSIIFIGTRAKDNSIFIAYLKKINVSVTKDSRNLRLPEWITVSWLYWCLITQLENIVFSVASFSFMCHWTYNIPFTFLHSSLLDFLPDLPSLLNIFWYMVVPPYTTSSHMSLSFKS
jgi:hypothetical protein